MTRVVLRSGGGSFSLEARGHALGSPEGCAFLSGVVYALAGFLVNEDSVRVERLRLEPGDVDLRFRGGMEAQVAFRMAAAGFSQLAGNFPELVKVEWEQDPAPEGVRPPHPGGRIRQGTKRKGGKGYEDPDMAEGEFGSL